MKRLYYLSRIFSAYILKKNSQLTFWHETPQVNSCAFNVPLDQLGEYYMLFRQKALYAGPFDQSGIPLLNYHGKIGKQYNPIAIIQYGLGNYNLYKKTSEEKYFSKFSQAVQWLLDNLEQNKQGFWVWYHKFNWEYFQILKNPWYSALAQGQGVSILLRAYQETQEEKYKEAAQKVFHTLVTEVKDGGVQHVDENGDIWLEEYLVKPPSHVLNGFIWALWGVYDYYEVTGDQKAQELYKKCLKTLKNNLANFDNGYWSLYDLSRNFLKTITSKFYHNLHIVQLDVLYRLTHDDFFKNWKEKWQAYDRRKLNNWRAFIYKAIFKIFYY